MYLDLETCDRCIGTDKVEEKSYTLPENLNLFFTGKNQKTKHMHVVKKMNFIVKEEFL